MRRIEKGLAAAVLGLALAGCGDTTGPGGEATMQVAARGDDAPAANRAGTQGPAFSQALGEAEGTVDFRARVYARTDAGAWVELTRQAAERVVVDASGRGDARVVATAGVDATGYDRVRVVFEDVRANVTGGIRIGLGILNGTVQVDLRGDQQAVVERAVDVELAAGGSARLEINLNADAWLSQTDTQTRTVAETAFESAVTVTAR